MNRDLEKVEVGLESVHGIVALGLGDLDKRLFALCLRLCILTISSYVVLDGVDDNSLYGMVV